MRHILHISQHPLRYDHNVVPTFQPSMELLKQIEFDRFKCKNVNLFVCQSSNKLFYLLVSCRIWPSIFDRLEQELQKIICKLLLSLGSSVVSIFKTDGNYDQSKQILRKTSQILNSHLCLIRVIVTPVFIIIVRFESVHILHPKIFIVDSLLLLLDIDYFQDF